jgi:solute carrier family 25 iron transporter 28/37
MSSASESVYEEVDLEWEEWDGSSPFLHHCIAGSIAGVAEHVLLYPVDTVKTHMQAYCSTCPNNPANMSSPNPSMKAICTGPPSTAASSAASSASSAAFKHASGGVSTGSTSVASVSQAPHGMWSTMSNLINHGHSNNNHNLQNAARQSGTLTATLPTTASHAHAHTHSPSTSIPIQDITKGYTRLWRGVQTMTTGCIPAHALYFSSYEYTKAALSTTTISPETGISQTQLGTVGASAAGAISALFHDLVMTPMDTIKQRMQLGHYNGISHAFNQIIKFEGWSGLYRSFGVTVMTNIPYGMVMVSTNEFLRNMMMDMKRNEEGGNKPAVLDLQTTMLAGSGAGMVAAAITSPLDRVKTRLQTQQLMNTSPSSSGAGSSGSASLACPKASTLAKASMDIQQPHYLGFSDAMASIIKEEGFMGLWRGLAPRLMTHTPAVAISWTSYEAAKRFLHANFS